MINILSKSLLHHAEDVLPPCRVNTMSGHMSFKCRISKSYTILRCAHASGDNSPITIFHCGHNFEALHKSSNTTLGPDRGRHFSLCTHLAGPNPIPQTPHEHED